MSKQNLHQYQYKNVTISGLPGSGTTTLLKLMKEELGLDGWRGFSGGEFMRAYAKEKGIFQEHGGLHHDARHYEDDFDRQVDFGVREKLQNEEKWILESWISSFMAQQVPGVLKILVECSEYSVRVDRIVNRDNVTVDYAKRNIEERYQANLEKWSRMYRDQWNEWVVAAGKAEPDEPIDFWKPELYDLVIDTYSLNQEETLNTALAALTGRK